jgi:hypothetical protein
MNHDGHKLLQSILDLDECRISQQSQSTTGFRRGVQSPVNKSEELSLIKVELRQKPLSLRVPSQRLAPDEIAAGHHRPTGA